MTEQSANSTVCITANNSKLQHTCIAQHDHIFFHVCRIGIGRLSWELFCMIHFRVVTFFVIVCCFVPEFYS